MKSFTFSVLIAWNSFVGMSIVRAETDGKEPATATKEVVISGIKIGSRNIPSSEWKDIAISQKDTITFLYKLSDTSAPKQTFLYTIKLSNRSGNERTNTVGFRSTSAVWRQLASDTYQFSVKAFAPGSWETAIQSVSFTVDDARAAEKRKVYEAEAKKEAQRVQDSLAQATQTVSGSQWYRMWYVWTAIGAGILSIGLIIARNKKAQQKAPRTTHLADISEANKQLKAQQQQIQPQPNMSQIEALQLENSNLRAEIAALRGQIDALQLRSDELARTNKELTDQKDRLTEHKRQLEDLQEQKDALFAMVVHDIKNPAGLIKGLVELLRSYDLTAKDQQEIMEDLLTTSSKIVHLAQEVSKIMALESSTLKLNLEPTQINIIAADICQRNNVNAVKKEIKIIRDFQTTLPDVAMDAQKVEEVLDNLVSNAIKFSHKGALVKVSTFVRGKNLTVEVVDNGVGLSEEDIRKAFGRGAKLSARPTGDEPSSGLGLWIVKRIIEAHNGKVWVRSTLGKGSTFAFEIPLVQPEGNF